MQNTPDVELLGPPPVGRFGSPAIWLCTSVVMGVVIYSSWRKGIGTPGNGWASLVALLVVIALFAAAVQYILLAGRDIVLSVEGVRKGKGPRSKFIPWRGASFYYDLKKDRYVVAAKGVQITFKKSHFADDDRYGEVVGCIEYAIYEQALQRNAQAPRTIAPLHRLSAADRAEFLAYTGDGILATALLPCLGWLVFVSCLAYWAVLALLHWHPPLSGVALQIVNWILRTFSFLFRGWTGGLIMRFSPMIAIFGAVMAFPDAALRKRIRAMRTSWLEQFDLTQAIAISAVGLTCQTNDDHLFLPWSHILNISRTRGLILFHLTPELTISIILPRRVFATPADAEAFHHQARAFKTAAQAEPNIVEPVSFWEIA